MRRKNHPTGTGLRLEQKWTWKREKEMSKLLIVTRTINRLNSFLTYSFSVSSNWQMRFKNEESMCFVSETTGDGSEWTTTKRRNAWTKHLRQRNTQWPTDLLSKGLGNHRDSITDLESFRCTLHPLEELPSEIRQSAKFKAEVNVWVFIQSKCKIYPYWCYVSV